MSPKHQASFRFRSCLRRSINARLVLVALLGLSCSNPAWSAEGREPVNCTASTTEHRRPETAAVAAVTPAASNPAAGICPNSSREGLQPELTAKPHRRKPRRHRERETCSDAELREYEKAAAELDYLYKNSTLTSDERAVVRSAQKDIAQLKEVRQAGVTLQRQLDSIPMTRSLTKAEAAKTDSLVTALNELNAKDREITDRLDTMAQTLLRHEHQIQVLTDRVDSLAIRTNGTAAPIALATSQELESLKGAVLRSLQLQTQVQQLSRQVEALEKRDKERADQQIVNIR